MSKVLDLFEVGCERQKPALSKREIARQKISLGIPANITAENLLEILAGIDQVHDDVGSSSQKGVDMALAALDILDKRRNPEIIRLDDGRAIVRPYVLTPNTAETEGFDFALREFIVSAPTVKTVSTLSNLNKTGGEPIIETEVSKLVVIENQSLLANNASLLEGYVDTESIALGFDLHFLDGVVAQASRLQSISRVYQA